MSLVSECSKGVKFVASLSGQGNVAEYKHDLIHANINLLSILFLSLEDVSCLSCLIM